MPDSLTAAQLAQLIPRECVVTYRLDGQYVLYDHEGTMRYRIRQTRLLDCSDRQGGELFLGMVIRRRAACFAVMAGAQPLGVIEGQWFIDVQGERFRLVDAPMLD